MSDEHEQFLRRSGEMMDFYHKGDYASALAVTERLASEFSGQAQETTYWRICLLSRLNKIEAALDTFDKALEGGLWWSETTLRRDPDLEPLQGLPEFESLVGLSERSHVSAQATTRPEMLVREPTADNMGPYPLVMVLHGQGGSAEGNLRFWQPACSLGWLVASLQSAQMAWPGAYAWEDQDKAQEQVLGQFESLCGKYPVDRSRVIFGGISQGAALAIRLTLNGSAPVRGFLAVVPGQIQQELLTKWIATRRNQPVRGYIVAGGKDPRYTFFKQVCETLAQYGIACKLEDHPEMGHEFPPAFEQSLKTGFDYLLAKE